MINKIEKLIAKTPLLPMTIIWVVLMFLKGGVNTLCQWEQAKLPDSIINGYIMDELKIVILLNILFIIILKLNTTFIP